MPIGRLIAASLIALLLTAATQPAKSGWFGVWKLRLDRPDMKPETLIYTDAGGGAMRMESVEDKSVLVTRFDGKPATDGGTGARPGGALAITATSPTSYDWTYFVAGKPWVRGRNRLAADLRSFSETSWRVAKPEDRITIIYERQPAN
ncbi:hypothetical protein [Sphingomonas sp. Y38-1Y]|uniref:hypothetical protein n=1 Tax=Sphingomonas sp. Y38-1Y TaxID=3078265 RepID=UPI0028E48ADA|nr:hypothetical protein [Sphingomonas sp. Y38-1Y]